MFGNTHQYNTANSLNSEQLDQLQPFEKAQP